MKKVRKKCCRWIYRPGTYNSHFAQLTCKLGEYHYLSRIRESEPLIGVADWYNGRLCPFCGGIIKMDYLILEDKNEEGE